ncbi:hypothetical protein BB560_006916 [Smittium megazygosporum]|uniref:Uncharacterized protein n=1 Tax=Smittium megazygosporum TaxID=133381 RepID=A0A2T9Y088_9FUNG|nr:hypothetical protein BB560_006916 [Smittium megazygosporum]
MKITITTLILFLSPVFCQYGYLSGKPNQQADLNSVMDSAGVNRFPCSPGYIGIDCGIPSSATLTKLSCYLKGKPGKSAGAVFIYNDPENSGASCPGGAVAPAAAPGGAPGGVPGFIPGVPVAPGGAPGGAPDIQKCMNKCVDDVLK